MEWDIAFCPTLIETIMSVMQHSKLNVTVLLKIQNRRRCKFMPDILCQKCCTMLLLCFGTDIALCGQKRSLSLLNVQLSVVSMHSLLKAVAFILHASSATRPPGTYEYSARRRRSRSYLDSGLHKTELSLFSPSSVKQMHCSVIKNNSKKWFSDLNLNMN